MVTRFTPSKQNALRWLRLFLLYSLVALSSKNAEAIQLQAFAGLENMKVKDGSDSFPDGTKFAGQALGLSAYVAPLSTGMFSLLAGGSVKSFEGSGEVDKIKMTLKGTLVSANLGVGLSIIPKFLDVQVIGAYAVAVTKELEAESIYGETIIESFNQMGLDAEVFYKVIPWFSVGGGLGMRQSTIKVQNAGSDAKFSGTAYSVLLRVAF